MDQAGGASRRALIKSRWYGPSPYANQDSLAEIKDYGYRNFSLTLLRYRLLNLGMNCQRNKPQRQKKSDQLHSLEARVPFLANDDMIVNGYAERARDINDRLRHLNVGV